MDVAAQHVLIITLFPFLFVGGWLVVSVSLARWGGWSALAGKCRTAANEPGKSFRFSSVALGPGRFPATYRGCVTVGIGEAGISLRVLPLFHVGHPRLLIPWSAVLECKPDRFFFQPCTMVNLAEPPMRLMFPGRAGQEIQEFWDRRS